MGSPKAKKKSATRKPAKRKTSKPILNMANERTKLLLKQNLAIRQLLRHRIANQEKRLMQLLAEIPRDMGSICERMKQLDCVLLEDTEKLVAFLRKATVSKTEMK